MFTMNNSWDWNGHYFKSILTKFEANFYKILVKFWKTFMIFFFLSRVQFYNINCTLRNGISTISWCYRLWMNGKNLLTAFGQRKIFWGGGSDRNLSKKFLSKMHIFGRWNDKLRFIKKVYPTKKSLKRPSPLIFYGQCHIWFVHCRFQPFLWTFFFECMHI